jgi:hypothetical protein
MAKTSVGLKSRYGIHLPKYGVSVSDGEDVSRLVRWSFILLLASDLLSDYSGPSDCELETVRVICDRAVYMIGLICRLPSVNAITVESKYSLAQTALQIAIAVGQSDLEGVSGPKYFDEDHEGDLLDGEVSWLTRP